MQTAASGEEALDFQERPPDLMLLDIQLPGMNGLEVLSRAKEFDDDLVVIMITALGGLETAVNAMRMGAYDYFNKPFNLDELAIIVRKALETRDLRGGRELRRPRAQVWHRPTSSARAAT